MLHLKILAAFTILFVPVFALGQRVPAVRGGGPAQNPGGGGPAGATFSGGAGGPGSHRKEMMEAVKEQLEITDDAEWTKLSAKIEKLLDAKQKTNTGAGMGWTTQNGSKPTFQPSNGKPNTAPGKAMQEIRDLAANKESSKEDITKKLAALKAAKEKAKADVESAKDELCKILTPWQEAVLVTLGVVE